MSISIPPPFEPFSGSDGIVSEVWYRYLSRLASTVIEATELTDGVIATASSTLIDIRPYSKFREIKLVVRNITQSVADEFFCCAQFSFDDGSTYKSAAGDYHYADYYNHAKAAAVTLQNSQTGTQLYSAWCDTTAGFSGHHELKLLNPYSTTNHKLTEVCSTGRGTNASYSTVLYKGSGACLYTDPIDFIKIFPGSGTHSCDWTLYGIA